jgi:hypothetical protein
MHRYTYEEIMETLEEAEASYISRVKKAKGESERQFSLSAVYATREIKKLFKEDWIKRCQK